MTISLAGLLITILIIGLCVYIIRIMPIDAIFKQIAYVVLLIFVLLWLVSLLGGGPVIRIG